LLQNCGIVGDALARAAGMTDNITAASAITVVLIMVSPF